MNDFTELSQLNDEDREREKLKYGGLLFDKLVEVIKNPTLNEAQKLLAKELFIEIDKAFDKGERDEK